MITQDVKAKYRPTIGIECHVQLKTATKLFSAVDNDAREAAPNTLVSHIDFGLPGALPVLNAEAIHLASRAAFALGTEPQKYSYFERKHYFYPDLPMGYQISQLAHPIVVGGNLKIEVDGKSETVRINRVQMEADAGKSFHPEGKDYSLVDLNRAGTPLLEIVSEPDIHSAAVAKAYAQELYLLMRYADVSDCNLYYGNMRFDVNVSVSKTDEFGVRTETKNLNSFKAVEKTVEYEINRQIELLERGQPIVQETRGWNESKQATFSMRSKENAEDYRYMPDPDLPPIVLDVEYIESVKSEMPVLPNEWRQRLAELGLDIAQINTLLEAELDDVRISYLGLIESTLKNKDYAKTLSNWFVNIEIPARRSGSLDFVADNKTRLVCHQIVYELTKAGKLNSGSAKSLLLDLLAEETLPSNVESYAEARGYIQNSDEDAIMQIVETVLGQNPKAAEDVIAGEIKAIGFLVGQVMKASQGKTNPQIANQLIRKKLDI